MSKIIKASNLKETETCRVDPPEPRLFFSIESSELDLDIMPEPEITPEMLLENAKEQAERILADAKTKAEQLKSAARQEGFELGMREALGTAQQEMAQEREDIARLKAAAEMEYAKRIWESEGEILKLACEIAEEIIRTSITAQPGSWLQMVREAVAKVAGANELMLKVSSDDAVLLHENLGLIREVLTESSPIRVESDSSMKPGDLWVESNIGQVDARITQQLQVILAGLRAGMVQP